MELEYEIINNAQATPHRLHALVRLVARLGECEVDQLADLLQPTFIGAKRASFDDVILPAALNLGLLEERKRAGKASVTLPVPAQAVESEVRFRGILRQRLTGATADGQPNFLLNQFTAWYAAQDAEVLPLTQPGLAAEFNRRMYAGASKQVINAQKLAAWRTWAAYLGWGWLCQLRGREAFMPDAYDRLAAALPALALPAGKRVEFGRLMSLLAEHCPELDGGVLFRRAVADRPERGNRLSLMLSTGLRALTDAGHLTLHRLADATEIWRLYPATGHRLGDEVTHLTWEGKDDA